MDKNNKSPYQPPRVEAQLIESEQCFAAGSGLTITDEIGEGDHYWQVDGF